MLELILTANIKDQSAYEKLAKDMPANVKQNEPETIAFRWMREDDGKRAIFVDGYTNANAFVKHYNRVTEVGLLDRLMACVDIDGVHAYGDINNDARKILEQFGANFYDEVGGFERETTAAMH